MEYETIRFEIADGIAAITLARPDRRNALTLHMADEIRDALGSCEEARAILLTGEGQSFCSGADLSELELGDKAGEEASSSLTKHYNPLILALAQHRLPVVCAVQGAAAGIGCSLAFACDFCVAGESAYFTEAFVKIGLIPDGGASWLLPRLIGKARATEMVMLGENIEAKTAVEWGLIHKAVADADLADAARDLAERLASGPTRALTLMKRNLAEAQDIEFSTSLSLEAEAQRQAADGPDAAEGIAAFLEKRAPGFTGE